MRIPGPTDGGPILVQHGFEYLQARRDDQLLELGLRINEDIDQRQVPWRRGYRLATARDCARLLLHGGSLLGGLHLGFVTGRIARPVKSRRFKFQQLLGHPPHRSPLLLLIVFASAAPSSQEADLIPASYLSPQYVAPPNAPSRVVVAPKGEPGERLVVTGRALDGTTPVAGVSVYVFHTDADGLYAAKDVDPRTAELNPRLHGAMRTDASGRYRYETIRPGSYNNNAAHVHYVVTAPGYKPRMFDLWFDDDPS